MQAVAAEFFGYAGNSAAFWREDFETVCFDSFSLKETFRPTSSVYLRP
jgi:hypothetical protein